MNGGTCIEEDGGEGFCDCPEENTGELCEFNAFCYTLPCQNGGTCTDFPTGFQCDCPEGFSGEYCENHEFCQTDPCQNGGTCTDLSTGFVCDCPDGFSGEYCEDHEFCQTDPCQNGGTCTDVSTGFVCDCPDEYTGEYCEYTRWCATQPCQNGGTCNDLPTGFVCDCPEGFSGEYCQSEDLDYVQFGRVYCDADADGAFSDGDLPLLEVTITTLAVDGSSEPLVATTDMDGSYALDLPDAAGVDYESSLSDVPNGASILIPAGGTAAFTTLEDADEYDATWLVDKQACSDAPSACDADPCVHGSCKPFSFLGFDTYHCDCDAGWRGRNCDRPRRHCYWKKAHAKFGRGAGSHSRSIFVCERGE